MKGNYNTQIYQRQGTGVREMRDHAELVNVNRKASIAVVILGMAGTIGMWIFLIKVML